MPGHTSHKEAPPRSKTTAFSYDDQDLIDRARARAKARRQSFSAYICTLLEEAEKVCLERGVLAREERILIPPRKKN